MSRRWQLHEAKARLSELVKAAVSEGPQEITLRGEAMAVVVSWDDYHRMTEPKPRFVDMMRESPLRGAELSTERDRSPERDATIGS